MTTTLAELAARLDTIEARLNPDPLALSPPIVIGSLANVPAPGSQLAAQWAQDVTGLAVHRFDTKALLAAWAAPTGAHAVTTDTGILWRRVAGGWSQVTPWTGSAAGVASNGVQSAVLSTLQIPADPGVRVANVAAFLQIQVNQRSTATIGMTVAGVEVAQAFVSVPVPGSGGDLAEFYNVSLHAENIVLAVNAVQQITVAVVVSPVPGTGTYLTFAGPSKNRIGATVFPKGY